MSEQPIVLVDEDGVEHEFVLHQLFDMDGVVYALLASTQSHNELIILRADGPLHTGRLVTLDDDEWERVARFIDETGLLDDGGDEDD